MAPKKVAQTLEAKEELKALLVADSFAQDFRPITLEKPKALLPLVNAALIDYALEWLAANRVEEVYVVCCAHAEQVKKYLLETKWATQKNFKVSVVVSASSLSMGDALRAMDSKGCISSDFVLLSADVVTNLDLAVPLEQHKARRRKDPNAIMTLVTKQVCGPTARARLGCKPLLLALDPSSQRLLRYQGTDYNTKHTAVDAHFFGERDAVQLRSDLVDSHVAICAPELLMLFTDNFDYQDLRRDFIPGVLSEEELGNKIYVEVLQQEYAARVHNPRAYDAISRDVLQRWVFPFVPDTNLLSLHGKFGASSYSYHRHHVYREQGVSVARDASIGHDTAVGAGTHIDDKAVVSSSIVGRGCRIGKGARIEGSYLHNNVTVWEGASVESAMLCEGVTVMPNARIRPGAIVSFKAVVGKGQEVGEHKRISLCRQMADASDSEDEREIPSQAGEISGFGSADSGNDSIGEQPTAANLSGAMAAASGNSLPSGVKFDDGAVGKTGAGFLWDLHLDERQLARTSLAPPPPWLVEEEDSSDEASVATAEDVSSEANEPPEGAVEMLFKQEVAETVLRCVKDGHNIDNAIVELNGLKIAENRTFAEVARYILSTLLSLCIPPPLGVDPEYRLLFPPAMPANDAEVVAKITHLNGDPPIGSQECWASYTQRVNAAKNASNFHKLLTRLGAVLKSYGQMLRQYLKGAEEQVDLLLTLEEFCDEEAPFGPAGHGKRFVPIFLRVLQMLYDNDYIVEDSFLEWAEEKKNSEAEEKRFLHLAQPFIDWLQNADEESGEDVEDEDDESD